MPFESFWQLHNQLEPLMLYGHSSPSFTDDSSYDFDQISALLDEAEQQFPHEMFALMLHRIWVTSRQGNVGAVSIILGNALAQGFAYPYVGIERAVGRFITAPEIQPLLEQNANRYENFLQTTRGELVVLEPDPPVDKPALLIPLHDNGSRVEWDMVHYRSATTQGCLVVMPQAALRIFEDRYSWAGSKSVFVQVPRIFAELPQKYTFDTSRVVMAGISEGGRAVIDLALEGLIPIKGFIVQAVGRYGFRLEREKLIPLIDASRERGLRAYIIVGEQDTFSYAPTLELVDLFLERHLPCALEIHVGLGHEFPPKFHESLARGFRFILGK